MLSVAAYNGLDTFTTPDGVERVLGLIPPTEVLAISPLLSATEGNTTIPRSEWKPTNRFQSYGDILPRYNQAKVGQCESTSEVESLNLLRAISGLPAIKLSPSFPYALVNNGQDTGVPIGKCYSKLMQFGTCRESLCPEGVFYGPQNLTQEMYADARNYRAIQGYFCDGWDELITAILLNCAPVIGVVVGANFSNLDKYGVTPIVNGMPNHALSAIDVVLLPDARWGVLCLNHWTDKWGMKGPFGGLCIITEDVYNANRYPRALAYQTVSIDATIGGGHDLPPALNMASRAA